MPEKVNGGASGAARKPWYKNKLWYFFNSLKLTLFVLIALAVVSIFGTVIEQNQPVQNYLAAYGEWWTKVILATDMNDLFHSWWFTSMLGLLALNIIVCTFERFPPKWKTLLNHKSEFNPRFIEKLSNNQSFSLTAEPSAVNDKVMAEFKRKRYKTMVSGEKGDYRIYAWKGIWGRFGSDLTHISLLLILAGAIIGSLYGYKDFQPIYVGGTLRAQNADFDLRLDKFWIDYYDTGQIRQYNSLLTVVEDGKDVMQKQIWVNEPLYYKGIRFYQSSYGMAWNKVKEAGVALMKKDARMPEDAVKVGWQETKEIPGTPYSVKLVGYTADFAYDERSNTVYSKSAEANNPAVMLEVYKDGEVISTPWLFMNYPGIFPAIPGSEDDLVMTGYHGIMYSGLSINKDPGTNVVWVGTCVMGIGFIFAFFVYHRRIWVNIKESDNSTQVRVGGMINKNNIVLEKELNDIVDAVKK